MRLAELKNHERELYFFQLRIGVAGVAVLVAFALLFARFVYLQVVQHDTYATKAEDNRISIVPIAPNRGLILDRNGVVLARNYSAYTLEIFPAQGARPRAHHPGAGRGRRRAGQGPQPLPQAATRKRATPRACRSARA